METASDIDSELDEMARQALVDLDLDRNGAVTGEFCDKLLALRGTLPCLLESQFQASAPVGSCRSGADPAAGFD